MDNLQEYLKKRFVLFWKEKIDNVGDKYFVAYCYDRKKKKQESMVIHSKIQLAVTCRMLRDDIVMRECWQGKHLDKDW